MVLKTVTFLVAAIVCLSVAYSLGGQLALQGAAVGAGAALVLCTISHWMLRWVRKAEGHAILTATFGSTAASFAFVLVTALLLNSFWKEILTPAVLTLLVVYLAVRFADALRSPASAAAFVPYLMRGPAKRDASKAGPPGGDAGAARGGSAP